MIKIPQPQPFKKRPSKFDKPQQQPEQQVTKPKPALPRLKPIYGLVLALLVLVALSPAPEHHQVEPLPFAEPIQATASPVPEQTKKTAEVEHVMQELFNQAKELEKIPPEKRQQYLKDKLNAK